MGINYFRKRLVMKSIGAASAFLFTCFSAGSLAGEVLLDSKADKLLKAMSSFLGKTKKFTVDTDLDFEVVTSKGQKLQLSSFAKVFLERPSKLYVHREGMDANIRIIYDGQILTLYGGNKNIYHQLSGSGTIDDAFRVYEMETGQVEPGASLLFRNPYETLSYDIEGSSYIGVGYVNGIECHHLAFRERKVDWQLWVQVGDMPLPMKFIVTSKFLVSGPQYVVRFRNWNTNPKIDAKIFKFTPPDGAREVDSFPTEELRPFNSIDYEVMARQTVREKIIRTDWTIPTLPGYCLPVVIQGEALYNCEGNYYMLEDSRYIMVEVY